MKTNKRIVVFLGLAFLIYLSMFFKISFALGSCKFFFSGVNFIQPLLSIPFLGSFFSSFLFFKFFAFSKLVTFGLPTLLSSLSWSISVKYNNEKTVKIEVLDFLLKVFLPLLCILLFFVHPEGAKAFLYSFYWFIPISIYFLNKFGIFKSILFKALSTTFIAHAVGSIIWLYTIPITSEQWLSLIPVVAIERLVFSLGMSFIYYFIRQAKVTMFKFNIGSLSIPKTIKN